MLQKAEKVYVEKGHRLLTVRKVGNQLVIGGDQRSVNRLRNNIAIKEAIEELLVGPDVNEEHTDFVFKDTKTIDIPPLFAQPGNKRQGWNAKNIERYLSLLFSLLGAGRGGDVDLSDKTKKPLWFFSKVDYKKQNKFQARAAEIPLEDPQVVTEDNVNDDVFLYCISSSC